MAKHARITDETCYDDRLAGHLVIEGEPLNFDENYHIQRPPYVIFRPRLNGGTPWETVDDGKA